MSSLPTRFLQHRIAVAGVPASLSYSAGTYLCNCIMYTAAHVAAEAAARPGAPGGFCSGFIHVPVRRAAAQDAGRARAPARGACRPPARAGADGRRARPPVGR